MTPNDGPTSGSTVNDSVVVGNWRLGDGGVVPDGSVDESDGDGDGDQIGADRDTVSLTYVRKVNGVTVNNVGSSPLTDTLDLSVAGNGDKGQTVRVEVTPNDGSTRGLR